MPMPNIKSIRGFSRRKSGGKDLEATSPTQETPSGSGFRVIPRDEASRRSIGGAALLDGRPIKDFSVRRQRSGEDWASNRGSNSTASSGPPNIFDTVTESAFTSSSTLQSPVEAVKRESPKLGSSANSAPFLNFSQDLESDDFGNIFASLSSNRRSRMLDGDTLTKPPAPAFVRTESEPMLGHMARPVVGQRLTATPPPQLSLKDQFASPYSNRSRDSRDALLSSPKMGSYSPTRDASPLPTPPPKDDYFAKVKQSNANLAVPTPPHLQRTTSQESFTRSGAQEDSDAQMVRDSWAASRALFSTGAISNLRGSKNKQLAVPSTQTSLTTSSKNSFTDPSVSSSASSFNVVEPIVNARSPQAVSKSTSPLDSHTSNQSTPRMTRSDSREDDEDDESAPLFDQSVISAIRAVGVNGTIEAPIKKPIHNEPRKVLTAKEFEEMQKRQHRATFITRPEDEESTSEGDYEDDEDDEAVQLQKRKAEQQKKAQHLVWRQKMVRAIGDHSSPLPARPQYGRMNQSTPNLAIHSSKMSIATLDPAQASPEPLQDDEDDDVPLGVLQAHGFPRKENPPDARLSAASYTGIQRPGSASAIPRPGSSAMSVSGAQRGGPLPPFARNLPQDPYFGQASLNSPGGREALPYGAAGSPQQSFVPMGAPPNGLVGVIADEESKRGMRRGSPNPAMRQSVLLPSNMPMMGNMPMMSPGGMMMMPNGMPMMMPPQQMGMGPDMQHQMLAQMQMMQQQNAALVEMLHHMNGNGAPPSVAPSMMGMQQPGYPQPRTTASRPVSLAQSGRAMSMLNPILPDLSSSTRTMSMMSGIGQHWRQNSSTPSVYGLPTGPGGNYAPSVAPSERSNIGQPSRYKPVQTTALGDGASTITSASTLMPNFPSSRDEKKKSFLSAIVHPAYKGKGKGAAFKAVQEEDDEDWSTFAQDRRAGAV